jgi:hypothetical protein
MANPNSSNVRVAGTGAIWKAPIGTPLPTDSTTAWNAAFVQVGYATNGFSLKQDLKTQEITAWQTLESVRIINTSLSRVVSFEGLESNSTTLALAWGGASIVSSGTAVGGAVTIGTAGAITTATAHGLAVGQPVQLGAITTSTGVTAGTTYYVITVGSPTTLVLSATLGGVALTTTAGSSLSITPLGAYSLTIPDAAVTQEFTLGIDWSDGSNSQRIILPRSSLLTLPEIKFVRDDAIRYPLEVQALKPTTGAPIQVLGNDVAAFI